MNIIKNYQRQILKIDCLNKFNYKNVNEIFKIKKIILNFNCKNYDIKKLSVAVLALELITVKKSTMTKSKKISSINLKIKKGQPVGCKVILEKKKLEIFLFKFLNKILPELKHFNGLTQTRNKNSFSFSLNDLVNFDELNTNFYLFSSLPTLNIITICNTNSVKELSFLLNSFKFPLI